MAAKQLHHVLGSSITNLHSIYIAVEKDYAWYVSSLPASARSYLDRELDWSHGGVEKDLSEIAEHMLGWDEKLSAHLELTHIDIHDIKETHEIDLSCRGMVLT